MRFAGEKIEALKEPEEKRPSTKNIKYPQDKMPINELMPGTHPTEAPLIRHYYMQMPMGGITQSPYQRDV